MHFLNSSQAFSQVCRSFEYISHLASIWAGHIYTRWQGFCLSCDGLIDQSARSSRLGKHGLDPRTQGIRDIVGRHGTAWLLQGRLTMLQRLGLCIAPVVPASVSSLALGLRLPGSALSSL